MTRRTTTTRPPSTTSANQTPGDRRPDVPASHHFYVDIGDGVAAVFTECSEITVETVLEPFYEGGQNEFEHRLPGHSKVSDVTLKQGLAMASNGQNPWWEWYKKTLTGQLERRNVTITVYTQKGTVAQSWTLVEAFPMKWTGPAFRAADNSLAIQSLTLTHRGIQLT